MHWSFWVIASVVLLIVEIITPGAFFFACLGIGAAATALVSVFKLGIFIEVLTFCAASILSIYMIRPIAKRFFVVSSQKSNVDALIGEKVQVTEKIDPPNHGFVKVQGELWRAESDAKHEQGEMVEITAVEGTRVKVK
ncbi:MAG: NfeD family protein [Endomicrobiales bacterium]|nr:NfeD family protein [Endomicrobiales bacterium]